MFSKLSNRVDPSLVLILAVATCLKSLKFDVNHLGGRLELDLDFSQSLNQHRRGTRKFEVPLFVQIEVVLDNGIPCLGSITKESTSGPE